VRNRTADGPEREAPLLGFLMDISGKTRKMAETAQNPVTTPVARHAFSRQVADCMEALGHCHATCLSTAAVHCLESGGEHVRPQHFRLMLDCAAACAFAADALARKSQFHNRICALAGDIATTCGRDCEALGGMEACAAACRETARLCAEVAKSEHEAVIAKGAMAPPH
jgi:hypothetical protein